MSYTPPQGDQVDLSFQGDYTPPQGDQVALGFPEPPYISPALIRFKRGTRAQLDAAAAASQLNVGEPYYLTDEEAYAIGTSATTYVDVGPADTAEWGGITGDITTQTDLIDTFLARDNTDVYTPSALYHPATKKYVDDGLDAKLTAEDNLSDLDSAATARTNLGLGTAAVEDTGFFATAAQGNTADTAVQPGDFTNTLGEIDDATDAVQLAKAEEATDTTAGRLLKVGDFGVGSYDTFSTPKAPDDINNLTQPGTYQAPGSAGVNYPSTNAKFGHVVVIGKRGGDQVAQVAYDNDGDIMFLRGTKDDGVTWEPWRELLHTGNTPIQPNATNLILDSGAKLGIGTGTPSEALEIAGGSIKTSISLGGNAPTDHLTAANNSGIRFGGVGLVNGSADLYIEDDTGDKILFDRSANAIQIHTNSTERLRIDSSGNLLVGTTSAPTTSNPKAVRYGVGVQANSLSSRLTLSAGSPGLVLNMANVVSGTTGTGLYLVTVVRTGGNVGSRWIGIVGVNSSAATICSTLDSSDITVETSSFDIQVTPSSTATYDCSAIPLAITP